MLSKKQKMAITHFTGPALVLAVPGAGKTTVIINRIAYLMNKKNIPSNKILSITFSRASAIDMEMRFKNTFPHVKEKVSFSTIHSFSYEILRDYSYMVRKKYRLIESTKSKINKYEILKSIYSKVNNDLITEDNLETLLNQISYIENMMIDVDDFENNEIRNFKDIYNLYIKIKRENNFIDFDDMLTLSYKALIKEKNLLNKYQNKYDFIQLDEGQDSSKIQLEIVKLIAKPKNNFFIVADDDQSIYGFRGADPEGLFKLEKEYPELKTYFMEKNYRSSKNIVAASKNLISNNSVRYFKNIFTDNGFLEPLSLIKVDSLEDQYKYILKDIKSNPTANTAILYRNNLSAIGLVNYLTLNNISFQMKDKKLRFFNHWVLWDIFNFLRFALNQEDINIYEKIYYKKKGYISKRQVNYAKNLNPNLNVFKRIMDFPGINDFYIRNLRDLEFSFDKLSKLKMPEAIDFILYDLEYENFLKEYSTKFGYNFSNLMRIVEFLKQISIGLNNVNELEDKLIELKEVCLNTNTDSNLILTTIHSAKGLEFDRVYIIDLFDGEFPSSKSIEDFNKGDYQLIEEERRLFYVAMTRAKYYLNILVVDSINNNKLTPSRFIDELS